MLVVRYKDEELMAREIKKFEYEIKEVVHDALSHSRLGICGVSS